MDKWLYKIERKRAFELTSHMLPLAAIKPVFVNGLQNLRDEHQLSSVFLVPI